MAVVDIPLSALDDPSTLVDWLRTELITNHRFTPEENNGTIGGRNRETWLSRPAAETFNGNAMLVHLSDHGAGTGILKLSMSWQDYATASNSGTRSFDDFTGTPRRYIDRFSEHGSCGLRFVPDGTAWLRGRLITSPFSGDAAPLGPIYFYVILETAADIYASFGFGEVFKLVDFTGGMFITGTAISSSDLFEDFRNNIAFGAGGNPSVNDSGSSLTQGDNPLMIWSSDWGPNASSSGRDAYGWMPMDVSGGRNTGPTTFRTEWGWRGTVYDWRGQLNEILAIGPSAFSLQTEKWPVTAFGPHQISGLEAGVSNARYTPFAILPDLFIANIASVDPWDVFQLSSGEKFIAQPYRTKIGNGTTNGSTGPAGVLIRNPDLTVTI